MGLSDESEAEDSTKRDPDWVETPISPETPMVPCQRRFQRRTRSTEASSSLIKNSESVQVREKNCFKILIKKSSRAPYLFLQNTPRTEYWRIWKSWVLMFESYLLIPNGSFCGKRLKNKNKKYAAVQEKEWYWTYSSAFFCVSSKEVLRSEYVPGLSLYFPFSKGFVGFQWKQVNYGRRRQE